ncbi:copper ABC transporter permease [Enterococcus sp. JM4C]|uniref:YfhO family protein n=1 Tax=Candidatus Enterococcus huntleyi TaxID=1857217 RepID=UPI00137B54F7|nr:YfhO family protein [Enterococcus sp. JM4C]KAF1297922.1 copper ABC transporter permease [Enterococcus sp. JM4C]
MTTIKRFLKANRTYMLASFFIPFFILALIYLSIGIYPGSSRSILASDAFSQFSNFHASFKNMLSGDQSIFYTWNGSLGLNYLSLVSYYLGGFFTGIVFFFPNQWMPDALYVLTLLKVASSGLAFWFLAKQTFKLPRWNHVALAVAYALSSFAIAHSEIIMWIDAFVYLPLIILGIHRVMDLKKPTVLFVSYLMLFLSSFYMGFMVGVFSFLYFCVRLLTHWHKYKGSAVQYGITSLLAGGASMIIILPALIDLRENGEKLSEITKLKTEATGLWDILIKNMVGVYDTTKYGSIPFIYVGLIPLVFCLLYFLSKQIPWKEKVGFASLFALLIASFYLVPLNLFWHGMHAPNMFLFRYAFLFSFLVVFLAGYGWEQFKQQDLGKLSAIIFVLIGAFCVAWGSKGGENYEYVTTTSFILTIVFLVLYLLAIGYYQLGSFPKKRLAILLLVLMSAEAMVNTSGMVQGILDDWNYASRSLYTQPYPDIKKLVDTTKQKNETFYRLENLDGVSVNDSFNYGYNGIGMFSSIRNRHSSTYLNTLGYRSRGTNLNLRYPNNTLAMDSFLGMKYLISKNEISDYGFTQIKQSGTYRLYENRNALPLGFLAPNTIQKIEQPATDNLTSQTNLLNGLSQLQQTYYEFYPTVVIDHKNTLISQNGNSVTYKEEKPNISKDVTWNVTVPANTQAYLSLFPTNFNQLESSTATITVNGRSQKSQINITGQYYDLGYYENETTFEFTASFYGTSEVGFIEPKVVGLDTLAYQAAIDTIKQNGVDFTVNGRTATGKVTTESEQTLVTTIPYDKGWHASIDGKKVDITDFKDAFVSLKVPKGTHTIKLSYLPAGFLPGALLFVGCLALFIAYRYWLNKKELTATKQTLGHDQSVEPVE